MLILLICIIIIILLILYYLIYQYFLPKPLNNVPLAPEYDNFIFGHARIMQSMSDNGNGIPLIAKWAKDFNYKPFQLIAPFGNTILVTCLPEHVAILYSKQYFTNFNKGDVFQQCFEETLSKGIFAVDGEEWREKRKVSSYLFSARSLRDHMAHTFREHARIVLSKLESIPNNNSIDIQELFQCYTFDSICKIAFGMEVSSLLGNNKDMEFQQSYDFAQRVSSGRLFEMFWKVRRFFGIGIEGELPKHIKIVNDYIYKIIDDRLNNHNNNDIGGDMLSLYIEHGRKKSKNFGRKYLRDMVLNFIIAGRDTTSAASTWLLYELSNNPHVEEKILQSISNISTDPSYDEICNLKYLRAVFYECLRLHPSVPGDIKFSSSDMIMPGNIFIQKGTMVDYFIYGMNRNPKVWKNPDKFDPERWIDENGNLKTIEESVYPVFNVAPRSCLGKRMAEFEALMLMVILIPKLKLRVKKGHIPCSMTNVVLFSGNGMPMTVEKRH